METFIYSSYMVAQQHVGIRHLKCVTEKMYFSFWNKEVFVLSFTFQFYWDISDIQYCISLRYKA